MGWNPFRDSWFGRSGAKRRQEEAVKQSEKSFQLQKDMFDWQIKQLEILEEGKESEKAKEAAEIERQLQVKRKGRSSTLKTVEIKQRYADFKAKEEIAMGLAPEKPVAPERIEPTVPTFPGDFKWNMWKTSRRKQKKKWKGDLDMYEKQMKEYISDRRQYNLDTRNDRVRLENWTAGMAEREAGIKSKYGKMAAFKRKSLGSANVKKRTLYA